MSGGGHNDASLCYLNAVSLCFSSNTFCVGLIFIIIFRFVLDGTVDGTRQDSMGQSMGVEGSRMDSLWELTGLNGAVDGSQRE